MKKDEKQEIFLFLIYLNFQIHVVYNNNNNYNLFFIYRSPEIKNWAQSGLHIKHLKSLLKDADIRYTK